MAYRLLLVLVLMVLVGSVALAERTCPPAAQAGERVEIAPNVVVTAVECPRGLVDGATIIEHSVSQVYENNRSLTMWVRPYPARGMTEMAFILEKGNGNFDNLASVDATIRGSEGSDGMSLRRVGPGRYCGHADFAPGWNRVDVWITTPFNSYMKTFNFWAGNLRDKPRQVNWVCPTCRVTTVSASCPVCFPE